MVKVLTAVSGAIGAIEGRTVRGRVLVVTAVVTISACAATTTVTTSGRAATASCPAGMTGAARDRLLGALSCAKQLGNGTLLLSELAEGGRTIRITYQEPDSLMTVETQQGAAGPQRIRVVEIGTDSWESQGAGRWTHSTGGNPPSLLERFADEVRQAATVDQTGEGRTFTVPASGPDNASLGGVVGPVEISLAANGNLSSLSGTAVNSDEGSVTSTVPFLAVFSQMGSAPPVTAPPSDQVDTSSAKARTGAPTAGDLQRAVAQYRAVAARVNAALATWRANDAPEIRDAFVKALRAADSTILALPIPAADSRDLVTASESLIAGLEANDDLTAPFNNLGAAIALVRLDLGLPEGEPRPHLLGILRRGSPKFAEA